MKLKHAYAGSQNVRRVTSADFKSVGLENSVVEWNPKNGHVAEVTDEAGQWLLDNEPGDWELVESLTSVEGESSSTSGSRTDDEGTTDEGIAPITTGTKGRRSSQS